MNAALDDVAFLALSANRVAILGVLADEEPHTRDELMETTDVSRPTLARILDDLEARTWITQRGQTCRITPLGAWVHEEFSALLETLSDERRLRVVVECLPFDSVPFDVRHLRDARIVRSTATDPIAPIRRGEEVLRTGSRHRMLTYQVACDFFEVVAPRIVGGEKVLEGVITPAVYESFLTDPSTTASFRELVDTGAATFHVVDDADLILHVVDDLVCLGLTDDRHTPRALVVTDDDAVYRWAEERFESRRAAAEPLDTDAIRA